MQENQTINNDTFADLSAIPERGRLVGLDPGTRFVGVAVSDELQITTRPLETAERTNWKALLKRIETILNEFDAVALVIGLPYNFDGSESEMSADARRLAEKFKLSLRVPVFLQDERATTYEARGRLWEQGVKPGKTKEKVDSVAAAIILSDFIARLGR